MNQHKSRDTRLSRFRLDIIAHENLYLNFFPEALKGLETGSDFEDSYLAWAKGQVFVTGYISAYHLWENQTRDFFREELSTLPQQGPRESWVACTRRTLKEALSFDIPEQIWDSIDRARGRVNNFKHGKFTRTKNSSEAPAEDVSAEEISELLGATTAFWNRLQ